MPPIRSTSPHVKDLRRNQSDAEQKFWLQVRNRRLRDYKFRRQATIGPFITDFLCAGRMLIVELDGGQHNEEADASRTRYLEAQGYTVMRFWNNEVLTNMEGALQTVLDYLEGTDVDYSKRTATKRTVNGHITLSPNPLPQAGEG